MKEAPLPAWSWAGGFRGGTLPPPGSHGPGEGRRGATGRGRPSSSPFVVSRRSQTKHPLSPGEPSGRF